jgi:hypothetical protein
MNTKTISRICGILYVSTVLALFVSQLFFREQLVDPGDISRTFRFLAENAFQY